MQDYNNIEEYLDIVGGNNGLADTRNPARIRSNNFFYRSSQEVLFANALYRRRQLDKSTFLFSPLSVWSQPGAKRRELDFLIFEDGYFINVEIDGESHNKETAFERDEKDRWLNENLLDQVRIRSYQHSDESWAEEAVDEALSRLRKIERRR